MSNFANQFKKMSDITTTENGGFAYKSTGSDLLSLFANIGGMRDRSESDIIYAWRLARKEDKLLADNLILYSRDIRNAGLGERKIGRLLLKELAMVDPRKVERNLQKIVDAGRWDDLFVFEGTPAWDETVRFIQNQFRADVNGMKKNKPISLLAKWLPSINASSEKTKRLARTFCTLFSLTPRTYRKGLSAMRKYIDVVERKMSAGQWNEINFETVPSVAMSRYIATYNKRCQERFAEYKASLEKGEAKVNAATLFPYDIALKLLSKNSYFCSYHRLDPVDEAQWKALPNYVSDEFDIVVMADVSGSMRTPENRPMATSIGLATYFAQRNKGAYHNMYLSFTDRPHFIALNDEMSLEKCLKYVLNEGIGYNTNLDLAFKSIFEVAKTSGESPKALVIISDMEIDSFCGEQYESIVQKWKKCYEEVGLTAPKLIWWNVASRGGRVLARQDENVGFVSGYGVGPFKNLQTLIEKDAYTAMVEILSQEAFTWN